MAPVDRKPVVFLAFANNREDRGKYLRNLPEEERGIREILERAETRDWCETVVRSNATADDILRVFQDPRYHGRIAIFHFGGHAGEAEIFAETPEGAPSRMLAGGLAEFLGGQAGLRLVFLNGCSTEPQVKQLFAAGVPAAIATFLPVSDLQARRLAVQFYSGLGVGDTIETAHKVAVGAARAIADDPAVRAICREGPAVAGVSPWELRVRPGGEAARTWSLRAGVPGDGDASVMALRRRHRSAVAARIARVEVPPSLSLGSHPPKLLDVFIPPDLEAVAKSSAHASGSATRSGGETPHRVADVPSLLADLRHAVLLGEMGAGKSTLLRYLALCAAEETGPWQSAGQRARIPVIADLADYAAAQQSGAVGTLSGYLQDRVQAMLAVEPAVAREFFSAELATGGLMLCLDGLDKVGTSRERRRVVDEIQGLMQVSPENQVFVTSRSAGYFEAPLDLPSLRVYRVLPPSSDAAVELLRRWCREMEIASPERLEQQPFHPGTFLLATIAALSYSRGGILPGAGDAAALGRFIDLLLDDWDRDPAILPRERDQDFYRIRGALLNRLGYSVQLDQREDGTGVWLPLEELERRTTEALLAMTALRPEEADRQARRFVDLLRHRAGLLLGRAAAGAGQPECSFWHASLQEYLTARHAAGELIRERETGWQTLVAHVRDPRWENVLQLTLGCLHDEGRPAGLLLEPLLATEGAFESILRRSLMLAGQLASSAPWLTEAEARPVIEALVALARRDHLMSDAALEVLVMLARFPSASRFLLEEFRRRKNVPLHLVVMAAGAMPEEQARQLCDRLEALTRAPDSSLTTPYRFEACRLLHRLGRTDRARKLLLRLSDRYSPDYFGEAVEALIAIGAHGDAVARLRRELDSPDQLLVYHFQLAGLFERLGHPAEAAELLLKDPRPSPSNVEMLERLGHPAEAEGVLRRALEIPTVAWSMTPVLVDRQPKLRDEALDRLVAHALQPTLDSSTLRASVHAVVSLTDRKADPGRLLRLAEELRALMWAGDMLVPELQSRGEAGRLAATLERLLERRDLRPIDRQIVTFHHAKVMLEGGLDSDRLARSIKALHYLARNPKVHSSRRNEILALLAACGHRREAVAAMKSLARSRQADPQARQEAIRELFQLGEEEAGIDTIAATADRPGGLGDAEDLAGWLLDQGHSSAAAWLAERLPQPKNLSSGDAPGRIRLLEGVGDSRRAAALRRRAIAWSRAALRKCRSLEEPAAETALSLLRQLDGAPVCTGLLLRRARRRAAKPSERMLAASFVADVGTPRQSLQALEVIASVADDGRLDPALRVDAWYSLAQRVE